MNSTDKAKLIEKAVDDKKAEDIVILDVAEKTSIADKFVLCSCLSSVQVKACADNIEYLLSKEGENVNHREGYQTADWILLDYGDVIAHVMTKTSREFYDIERLF